MAEEREGEAAEERRAAGADSELEVEDAARLGDGELPAKN